MPKAGAKTRPAATAVAILPAAPPAPRLLAIEPQRYVDDAFGGLSTELATAIQTVGKVVYDVTTPEGMTGAKEGRNVFRQVRWAIERTRKDVKDPITQLGKLIDGRAHELEDQVKEYEDHYAVPIEAEELRQADMARAREHAEMERIAGIERKVAAIANHPAQALNQPPSIIETLIVALECILIDASYAEYQPMAEAAKAKALGELQHALLAAYQVEADQAELAALRRQVGAGATDSPAPDTGSTPVALVPGDVLWHCHRYLIGLPEDYDQLLADVETSLTELGYDLSTHNA